MPHRSKLEFFKHHGIWAPGVRLFRKLQFSVKAGIITGVFLLPIAVLAVAFYLAKTEAIDFARQEMLGVEYVKTAIPLLHAAQQERRQPGTGLDAPLAALRAAEQKLGAQLGTAEAFAATVNAAAAGGDFEARTPLVRAVLGLVAQAGDGSNLTLDPDLDSYYLMDIALVRVPAMTEAAEQLRHAAADLGGPQGIRALMGYAGALAGLGEHMAAVDGGLGKVKGVSPALHAQVDAAKVMDAVHALDRQALAIQSALSEGKPTDNRALIAAVDGLQNELYAMSSRALDALAVAVGARADRLSLQLSEVSVLLAASLLLGGYLFYSFYLVTRGGLQEVRKHLEAMTAGDLTTQPRPWGRDEAAGLMFSLSDMQSSLRGIVGQVRGSSESLVVASREIAAASADLSARTESTAANLQQTASSVEEISGTVQQSADHASTAARLAADNAKSAQLGGGVIGDVMSIMDRIQTASSRIGEITGTIDGIAFQTNLLALNAAVEAARAGEHGRGFAVVASEVRTLAHRSADAAKQIKSLIQSNIEQVDAGSTAVRRAESTIGELVDKAAQMQALLSDISAGADEQRDGIAQVTSAVQDIDRMTQQNAALVEQTSAGASALSAQAGDLAERVARFKLPQAALA